MLGTFLLIMENFIKKAHNLVYFTSNQALIFDKEGNQIRELQSFFANGEPNRKLLLQIAENCEVLSIGKWCEWQQELSKEDFIKLLHLNCV